MQYGFNGYLQMIIVSCKTMSECLALKVAEF